MAASAPVWQCTCHAVGITEHWQGGHEGEGLNLVFTGNCKFEMDNYTLGRRKIRWVRQELGTDILTEDLNSRIAAAPSGFCRPDGNVLTQIISNGENVVTKRIILRRSPCFLRNKDYGLFLKPLPFLLPLLKIFLCFLGTVTLSPLPAIETGSTKRGPLLWSVKLYAQWAQSSIKKYMLHLVLLE